MGPAISRAPAEPGACLCVLSHARRQGHCPGRDGRVSAYRMSAALATGLLVAALSAHATETPRLTININESRVRNEISLPIRVFDQFFPARRRDPDYFDPAERERATALVEKAMKERNAVTIDGVRVGPVVESVEFVPAETADEGANAVLPQGGIPGIPGVPGIEVPPAAEGTDGEKGPEEEKKDDRIEIAGGRVLVTAVYAAKDRPRTVSMVWELFPGPRSPSAGKMYAGLAAFEDWQEIVFSQQEPEYVWHALERPSERPLAAAEAPPEDVKVRVPVVTLAMLLAAGVFLVIARARKLGMRTRAVVAGALAVLAVALVGVGGAEVTLPWKSTIRRPDDSKALEMFAALHANIYDAFEYKTESDIYDVLAQSVDGPLLDAIYNEIYQGLILRDQGGAVCKIESVKMLESKLVAPEDSPARHEAAFGVECRWRVRGAVHHWGHTHTRVNEFVAAYTVEPRSVGSPGGSPTTRPRAASWKITASQVLDEKRVLDETTGEASGQGG